MSTARRMGGERSREDAGAPASSRLRLSRRQATSIVRPHVAALAAALLAACVTPAYAQGARWADPYRNGVKAFEGGRCNDAIPLLERAVAADPKAEANKRIEGVFRVDYFPYYYLALCYVEQQRWDKASENLDKARSTLKRDQQAKFAEAEGKIKLASAPKADPRKAAYDAAVAQAESALSNKQFDAALRQFDAIKGSYAAEYASTGLASKRDEAARGYAGQLADEGRALVAGQKYTEAKAKFQQADQAFPGQRQVADLLAEIRKREDDYQQLKAQALNDLNGRNYASARDKLEQARQRHAELFANDGLAARLTDASNQIARGRGARGTEVAAGGGGGTPPGAGGGATAAGGRGTPAGGGATPAGGGAAVPSGGDRNMLEAQRLAKSARDYISQGKYAEADRAYASALKIDPKNQEASDAIARSTKFKELRDRGTEAERSKNVGAAQQALADAKAVDAERFAREGLGAVLDSLNRPPNVPAGDRGATQPDPARAALQQGLLALLNGRAQESINILEPAASKAARSASLHAYLGVAYATQALSAPKADDRSRLQTKALDEFRLAKSAQPDYRLSPRIVSPAIVSIYQSAKP